MGYYENRANAFAQKTGTRLSILGEEWKPMWGETSPRSVFKCRLSRGGRSYTFEFGQSIINEGIPPTMYEVLSCLTKHDPETFEDFCAEFGYNEDSRNAEKTYKEVCKEWKAVYRLFSDVLDELREIN